MVFSLPDLIALIFLIGFLINGFRRGFILTTGHFVAIVAGILSARFWSPVLAARLVSLSTFGVPRGWLYIIAAILIFFLVAKIVSWVASFIHSAFKILTIIPFLETANKIAGALLGVIVGAVFIGGLGYLLTVSRIDPIVTASFHRSMILQWCQETLFVTLRPWL